MAHKCKILKVVLSKICIKPIMSFCYFGRTLDLIKVNLKLKGIPGVLPSDCIRKTNNFFYLPTPSNVYFIDSRPQFQVKPYTQEKNSLLIVNGVDKCILH